MGRLFWKFFLVFWLAQVVTALGVGVAIWALRPTQFDAGPSAPPHFAPPPPGMEGRRPPPHGAPPPRPFLPPLMPLLAGSVVSLIFAALLAWYFARPIRGLRTAFEALAGGALETRIGRSMGRRRDELADLGADFDCMADRLQGLMDGQRRLLHDVSHELRSPLARLQAAAGLMRQQPERAVELLERIERDTGRMDRLVGELLTLARLDAGVGDDRMESLDLDELLAGIAEDVGVEAEAQGVDVRLAPGDAARVRGDADLLRRALENVLRNAVKHSPRGAAVEVCGRVDAEVCCVAISDRGPGVAESELVSIFEPFYRGAGAARQGEGYGLGLAIAKSVMQRHRGTVAACNRSGGGLVVSLCLPRG
jgi:signal transduction histidine kinase